MYWKQTEWRYPPSPKYLHVHVHKWIYRLFHPIPYRLLQSRAAFVFISSIIRVHLFRHHLLHNLMPAAEDLLYTAIEIK